MYDKFRNVYMGKGKQGRNLEKGGRMTGGRGNT